MAQSRGPWLSLTVYSVPLSLVLRSLRIPAEPRSAAAARTGLEVLLRVAPDKYGPLVVRESVSVSARGQASFGGGRLGRILKEGNPLAMLHFLGTDRVLLTVAVVFSVSHFAMSGTSTIEKLYQEYLFSWEALQQGYVQSVSSVVSVGSKVVVLPVCVALFRERKAVAVIFTIAAAGYGCTAAAGLPMHGGALDLGRTARVAWCGSWPLP